MALRKLIYFSFFCVISAVIILCNPGCANIIPPTGGPRDSLPPLLVQVYPKDSALNFKEKKITFSFNEYVNIENIQENLIVSPLPKINPDVEFRLRTVTVRIKDTLEPNTTYSMNFGDAIRDVNEGNVLKAFTYVFSTGATLSNQTLSGKVQLAETGKTDSTLTVLLHRSATDSAVIKERPRYIARVNREGGFTFTHLPAGTFYLYALKDEGGTRRYLSKAQLFAFADKPVIVDEKTAPVTLYAYVENTEPPRKPAAASTPGKEKTPDKRLVIQNNLDNGQQDLLSNFDLQFANPLKTFDTSKLLFANINFVRLPGYTLVTDSTQKKVTLVYAWQPDSSYNLILNRDFAADSLGRKILKTDTISFKARKTSDYGSLRIRFTSLDLARRPVLLLIQSDKIVYSQSLTGNDFTQKLVKPGDYEARILYDDNRNGQWDAGAFFGTHRQPEKVQAIPQTVKVKVNWSNDVKINL